LAIILALALFLPLMATAQSATTQPATPQADAISALYRQLRTTGLDPARVYSVRDASLDREDIHITFSDGVIGFTQEVNGKITGAFFEGEGELLLSPPSQVERSSLALFTGDAVLEEQFATAYLRFNDQSFQELEPYLRPPPNPEEFLAKWANSARSLAETDALRLLLSLTSTQEMQPDRMLHARFSGMRRGTFDLFFDTLAAEQISVGQTSYAAGGLIYFDLWTSFRMRSLRMQQGEELGSDLLEPVRIPRYTIRAQVNPPHELQGDAQLEVNVRRSGRRILLFELSRNLQVKQVEAGGVPLQFIQNEALQGSQLARRGNDLVAVVFPQALQPGEKLKLRFRYGGSVLSEAGGGLMYVGARGIWYPNQGLEMSTFDLEFRYPAAWSLVATGKRVSQHDSGGEHVARWVSERPIPVAGFNLGQYVKNTAKAGNVEVETYAAQAMENTFPAQRMVVVPTRPLSRNPLAAPPAPVVVTQPGPQPARNAQTVTQNTARAIDFFSRRLGPFPYSSLSLTQMPGRNSQGWPGLVFLSSFVFLSPEEHARLGGFDSILYGNFMPAHETAHQWWGDLILWKSYRDQWLVEALSNYCALAILESERPAEFHAVLEHYRRQLLAKNKNGLTQNEAGTVTLGFRLSSSKFPDGYDNISYGRGTWLFHMLRHLLKDSERNETIGTAATPIRRANSPEGSAEPFFRVLRRLRERFEGKEISNANVQQAFEEALSPAVSFEGKKSLDWFFEGWVNGTALPRLELKDVKFSQHSSQTAGKPAVSGTIHQKEAPESLVTSVPVYGIRGAKEPPVFLGRVFADGPETNFRLSVPPGIRKLVLDPFQTVLTRP